MRPTLLATLVLLAPAGLSACAGDKDDEVEDNDIDEGEEGDGLTVEMETSMGLVVMRLEGERTPLSTANFSQYVDEGFYDGSDGLGATLFHRVLVDFVVQGGIYDQTGAPKDTREPVPLETDVGLSNLRGTLAMARTSEPDSATASFYINHVDNTFLDYESEASPGYAVFGEVTEGMDVIDEIAAVAVDPEGWPDADVTIVSMTRY